MNIEYRTPNITAVFNICYLIFKGAIKNKKQHVIITYCFFIIAAFVPALAPAQSRGKVEVLKDPLIDTLIARRPTLDKTNPAAAETTNGYRVQIYFGSNRQAAYNAQAKFKNEYPEYRTYISYTEPNFRVQAGDFRTRLEAQKLLNELTQLFTSLFILPGKINQPTPPETTND